MKKLVLFSLLMLATPAAWAQYAEIWFNGGQSLFSNSGLGTFYQLGGTKDDVKLTDGFRFSFRVGFNGDGIFGHEIQYAYSRTHLRINAPTGVTEQGMAVHTGGYNFLVYANHEGNRVRPFATGGIQFSNYVPPGSSALSYGGQNKFGVNYGGGVKIRVRGPWAVRFDLRQYTTPKPFKSYVADLGGQGWIRQTEVSAGVGIVF